MTKHKIAVITGAGSGIGLALTNEFLSRDPNMLVVALCRDSSARIQIISAPLMVKR